MLASQIPARFPRPWGVDAPPERIRAIPIVVGALGGLLPDVWPSWVAPTWAVTLGGTAGLRSVALYHGVKVTLPKLFAVLPEAFKKRLGGD